MLSYQHIYHAGNFADVHKHTVLCLLLEALSVKEKPFFVLDAFAGRGGYEFDSDEAEKTGEYHLGIERLWGAGELPELMRGYLDAVGRYNGNDRHATLCRYPGSPWLIRDSLRPQDRMALCELHPGEFEALRQVIRAEKRVQLLKRDAIEGVKGLLPPKERRGLLLVDPSYESKSEYVTIAETIVATYRHWREGTYAIWYPILPAANHEKLRTALKRSGIRKILDCSLSVDAEREGMFGTGMLVINPPWKLKEQMELLSPFLWKVLARDRQGSYGVKWLVSE
jgi:23S rRNA (adenine2030-N6)-methyltransferase